jgi:NNP family nitrate/nitrite transporter-like MFS transporter
MGSVLFPLFKAIFSDADDPAEKAWRTVSVVPAIVAFASGVAIYFIAEDAPKGNYGELKKHGAMPEVSAAASFRSGALNINTWLLFVQYACCFGVELTMNNAAALYFKDEFGQSTESAAAIASIFGWMNLFARGLGGFISDKANAKMGMRGRLATQTFTLFFEGLLVILFANTNSLGTAILVLVFFSLCVQAAEGSSYGIVPYVDPPSTGSIAGIVGAGGNTGAVCFGLGFRQLEYYDAFILMGSSIIVSSVLSVFIFIKGHSGLLCGKEDPIATKAAVLAVPQPDEEEVEESGEVEESEEEVHA